MSKYTRIQDEDLEKLRVLSKYQRRTMTMQLKHYIEPDYEALMRRSQPPTSFDSKPVKERMAEMKPEDVPESWLTKDDPAFTGVDPTKTNYLKPKATYNDKPKAQPKKKTK